MELFNGMFGKVAAGMCRLSMNGGIAIKTSNGYKTYKREAKVRYLCWRRDYQGDQLRRRGGSGHPAGAPRFHG